jgi:hypothetical protein
MNGARIPAVVAGICDDAAVFPPGLAPLPDAVRAHLSRAEEWYSNLIGPLVLAAPALPGLATLLPTSGQERSLLPLSLTLPGGPADLGASVIATRSLPVELRAIEVALPTGMGPAEFFDLLSSEIEEADGPQSFPDIYVEVPRDPRGPAVLELLPGSYRAKFRTGGVRAELYPDETELAATLSAVVAAGVPFKATAGLHHALRNTDPDTGFEQHGFLNLLLATDALAGGGSDHDARALLAERDGAMVADQVRGLEPASVDRARTLFTSFGTCSITDPLTELLSLDLLSTPATEGVPA